MHTPCINVIEKLQLQLILNNDSTLGNDLIWGIFTHLSSVRPYRCVWRWLERYHSIASYLIISTTCKTLKKSILRTIPTIMWNVNHLNFTICSGIVWSNAEKGLLYMYKVKTQLCANIKHIRYFHCHAKTLYGRIFNMVQLSLVHEEH